ncbi:methyltransferase domain-containing protein [Dipodascopsis tothii]|uniref:methyltransferase domain-containing protein n=1 Tax=Dipodascopsis tothii TaxID=44089 RepID=UPI0034CE57D9
MAEAWAFPLPAAFSTPDEYLAELTEFYLDPFVQQLAGHVHILDFFATDPDLFEQILPAEWVQYMDAQPDADAVIDYLISGTPGSLPPPPPSLAAFIGRTFRLSMVRTPEQTAKGRPRTPITVGMSPKKVHECDLLSKAIAELCARTETTHVIDLGSGKGYLSRMLAHDHGCDVIAVENMEDRAKGAEALDALFLRKSRKTGEPQMRAGGKFVDSGDLADLIDRAGVRGQKVVMTGLHACGNLSHHAIRALVDTPEIAAVAVVGCCYNLMTEQAVEADSIGYPMSRTLAAARIPLPLTARMLACQAPATWTRATREAFFTRHFYRALLQRVFLDRGLVGPGQPKVLIGSLRKQWYASFAAYCAGASGKLAAGRPGWPSVDAAVAEQYLGQYGTRRRQLALLWTLMACTVAPLTEAVIHLDRFYFVREAGARHAAVRVVFDQALSARNLVVVGIL